MGPYPPIPSMRLDPLEFERANRMADAIDRRVRFKARHGDFVFRFPWEAMSGKFKVTTPMDGVLTFDDASQMMDDLEERYPT
jgi:hypothetical protein